MTKVFIGDSRTVLHLNVNVQMRLDTMMEKGFAVLVGDANGADKAAQAYLHGREYPHVEVFCAESACRNNRRRLDGSQRCSADARAQRRAFIRQRIALWRRTEPSLFLAPK
jgi:hypothetical protein